MSKEPLETKQIVDDKPLPPKTSIVTNNSERTNATNEKHNDSEQEQLLRLAKQFNIDAAVRLDNQTATLEERARKRERINHLRKQQNLESIIEKAVGLSANDKVSDKAEQDWFNSYLMLAADISNKTMQELWANILAKEISLPGSFSLKTLEVFNSLSVQDAKLLARVSSLVVKDTNKKSIRLLSGSYQVPGLLNFFNKNKTARINLAKFGINYTDLLLLADKQLLFIQEAESSIQQQGDTIAFNYNGSPLTLTTAKANCVLNFYKFTPVGAELLNLIPNNKNIEFINDLKGNIREHFQSE